ncbi:MAG: class I SAM-dependent methyltransferase [Fimbriimonadaceae bacterium]
MREEALAASKGLKPTPAYLERLTKTYGIELTRWAFSQWELRDRAKGKFKKAAEMLFDREALEMATHEEVATFHASLFPAGVRVADLTCGIGADLIALARNRDAIGFELDPIRAEYARHNLAVHDLKTEVRCEDSLDAHADWEFAFADPARRISDGGGRRVSRDGSSYSPSLESLTECFSSLKGWLIKLSPLLADSTLSSLSETQIFVSHQGECKEVLCTNLPLPEGRAAGIWGYQVESANWLPATVGQMGDEPRGTGAVSKLSVYEADPAAIRAHCLPTLCGQFNLEHLGDSNGYLIGASGVKSAWLKEFEIMANPGNDERALKRLIQELGPKQVIVKQRGCNLDPVKVGRQLLPKPNVAGDVIVVLAFSVGKSLRYIIAKLP